jgi:hypothetical protein
MLFSIKFVAAVIFYIDNEKTYAGRRMDTSAYVICLGRHRFARVGFVSVFMCFVVIKVIAALTV